MPNAAYYAAHRDELRAYNKANYKPEQKHARYTVNREAVLADVKARYQLNREARLAYGVKYHEEHRTELIAKGKVYRAAHVTERLARNAAYRTARPEWAKATLRAAKLRRRARERGADGDASPAQIEARVAMWGGLCWMCGDAYNHIDHVKPLSKGGSNWPANLRPACAHCNKSKNDSWPLSVAA